MNAINMVLCGLGGQGILLLTKVLSQAALRNDYNVMVAETHGMAQRGGSVVSHIRLGNVQGSLVQTGSAQIVLALEENEGYRNLPFLAPGGLMLVNTPSASFPREEVKGFLAHRNIGCRGVPATSIAVSLGVPQSSNLALLGFFSAYGEEPFEHDHLRAVVMEILPEPIREKNLQVFDAAFERGMEEQAK